MTERKSRVLFGSCNSQYHPQPLWPYILQRNPAVFVWGGDAVYADRLEWSDSFFPRHVPATPEVLEQCYRDQFAVPGYQEFLRNNIPVFGTIDDHDYGIDNGDARYPYRRESAMLFVESFLGESKDSPMAQRARNGHGVYGVKLLDFDRPPGQELIPDEQTNLDPDNNNNNNNIVAYSKTHSVAIFLLDVRSKKTPYGLETMTADFLGERQWKWLEEAMRRSEATVHVVVNGLQVHADRHPNLAESWSRFPRAQQRLYQTILQHNKPIVLISGDVHHAQLLQKDCRHPFSTTRPLVEMTTSGMTHSWSKHFFYELNDNYPFYLRSPIFSVMSGAALTFGHWVNPWTDIITLDKSDEGAKSGLQYTLALNYGELEFDWTNRTIRARVMGEKEDSPLLSILWTFDQLMGEKNNNNNNNDEWYCANHRGFVHPTLLSVARGITWLGVGTIALAPIWMTLGCAIVIKRVFR